MSEAGRILITGATGFIGGELCQQLVAKGSDVVAFVRKSSNVRRLTEMGRKRRIPASDSRRSGRSRRQGGRAAP